MTFKLFWSFDQSLPIKLQAELTIETIAQAEPTTNFPILRHLYGIQVANEVAIALRGIIPPNESEDELTFNVSADDRQRNPCFQQEFGDRKVNLRQSDDNNLRNMLIVDKFKIITEPANGPQCIMVQHGFASACKQGGDRSGKMSSQIRSLCQSEFGVSLIVHQILPCPQSSSLRDGCHEDSVLRLAPLAPFLSIFQRPPPSSSLLNDLRLSYVHDESRNPPAISRNFRVPTAECTLCLKEAQLLNGGVSHSRGRQSFSWRELSTVSGYLEYLALALVWAGSSQTREITWYRLSGKCGLNSATLLKWPGPGLLGFRRALLRLGFSIHKHARESFHGHYHTLASVQDREDLKRWLSTKTPYNYIRMSLLLPLQGVPEICA
ncbi:hypothetical protein WN51_00767 [Melipona quadrifasciata]|uniref:Uncharacterized protein n=1 Tax=Melipona quadrifasciata TaxID=166423 RepID=A0A0M8ZXC0_9HYME|nr:hypothetical protein WN51_00767 [Melipona quadrifasciata]